MDPIESVTVFEISDDRREFLCYLDYLYEQGFRPSPDAWISEAAARLIGLENARSRPAAHGKDDAWTVERRRLLVALTWPYAHGELAPRMPFALNGDRGVSGVYGRTYRHLWADVRTNMTALQWLAEWRGDWEEWARTRDLDRDVLSNTARLGLVVTPAGRHVSTNTVKALRADTQGRVTHAIDGFVLTWWDIVAIAECVGFSFEPTDPTEVSALVTSGRWFWNRADLAERISDARPLDVHRRITANGRITPPATWTKYRALFEQLDAVVGEQTLSRDDLDQLLSHAPGTGRTVRGARGTAGLPPAANSIQWWYGPWNPDTADRSTSAPAASWVDALKKKPQTRAWMAAGLRAKPTVKLRTVVAVQFEPVTGREDWWHLRNELRSGSYANRVTRA